MALIIELFASILFELVAYAVGRVFAFIFLPFLRVEPFMRRRASRRWQWEGFTYTSHGRRYLRLPAAQLLGIVVLTIFIGVFAAITAR